MVLNLISKSAIFFCLLLIFCFQGCSEESLMPRPAISMEFYNVGKNGMAEHWGYPIDKFYVMGNEKEIPPGYGGKTYFYCPLDLNRNKTTYVIDSRGKKDTITIAYKVEVGPYQEGGGFDVKVTDVSLAEPETVDSVKILLPEKYSYPGVYRVQIFD